MDLAVSQRREDDDELFGVLHLSDPVAESGTRFFSLRFRSPDDREWVLLESFSPDPESYIVPTDVARNYASLQGFLADVAEGKPQILGTHQISHAQGRTVEQHVDAVMSALATSNDQQ